MAALAGSYGCLRPELRGPLCRQTSTAGAFVVHIELGAAFAGNLAELTQTKSATLDPMV